MIKCVRKETNARIFFKGEHLLNEMNTVALEKKITRLLKIKITGITISFNGIRFIDSNGFRLLMRINENLRFEGVDIILADLSEELMELFLLLRLDNKFRFENKMINSNNRAA